MHVYQQHLEIQVIAQYLAKMFNQAQRKVFKKDLDVFYIDAAIVRRKDDPNKVYQVEPRLKQKIQKWNSNCGGVDIQEYFNTLQAFSHWTYHKTAGRMMVVDLQGLKSSGENGYLLTDPAIHFDSLVRYREARTNLGPKGMREFFRTHLCSRICEKLGLEKVKTGIDADIVKQFYTSSTEPIIEEVADE